MALMRAASRLGLLLVAVVFLALVPSGRRSRGHGRFTDWMTRV